MEIEKDATIGYYLFVKIEKSTYLDKYLREVRFPFAVNPPKGYKGITVNIATPNECSLFAFGNQVTKKDIEKHVFNCFDGQNIENIFK